MNSVYLVGKVGKDPEVRYIGGNKTAVASFSVATSRNQRNNSQDNWLTTWHDIKVWGKAAERVNNDVRKGDTVAIHGRIDVEQWEKDGQKHRRVVIVADSVVCSPKQEEAGQGNSGYSEESAW